MHEKPKSAMPTGVPKPLRVLIVGGGISDTATAFWLRKLGHTCTIVERSSELREVGQQLYIRQQAVIIAEPMGILTEIAPQGVNELGLRMVNASGKQTAYFPRGKTITSVCEIMRGNLSK